MYMYTNYNVELAQEFVNYLREEIGVVSIDISHDTHDIWEKTLENERVSWSMEQFGCIVEGINVTEVDGNKAQHLCVYEDPCDDEKSIIDIATIEFKAPPSKYDIEAVKLAYRWQEEFNIAKTREYATDADMEKYVNQVKFEINSMIYRDSPEHEKECNEFWAMLDEINEGNDK